MTASRDTSAPLPLGVPPPNVLLPWTITPSAAERAAGKLAGVNLATAVEGLHREGVILLKQVTGRRLWCTQCIAGAWVS